MSLIVFVAVVIIVYLFFVAMKIQKISVNTKEAVTFSVNETRYSSGEGGASIPYPWRYSKDEVECNFFLFSFFFFSIITDTIKHVDTFD